ncbi:hypothetical protein BO99DRAFT_393319 [Aspergillus violaceofuscus CBS 115571]|uniref:Uncharacterized protein n=1 Tax=Aspergillus violaceofuscus (strain CBS 115571) TaxID=1450538 RepID=A0A2V5GUS4_ASPV1|nr:hypothetical protein BO99DRAFT_393319 [Aspergillus violaceofuscus CBS 115571]
MVKRGHTGASRLQTSHVSCKTSTYDHRVWKTGLPVRSAVLKPHAGRLVVGWVTTSESLLLTTPSHKVKPTTNVDNGGHRDRPSSLDPAISRGSIVYNSQFLQKT